MIKKLAIGAGALALTAGFAVAAPASAAPMNEGAACVQAGIGTLKGLSGAQVGVPEERTALLAAAKQKIDYSTLADPVNGPIFTTLPEGSNLSLGQVVKLHTKAPSLFAWCR